MPKGTPFQPYDGRGARWPESFDIFVGDCGYIEDFYYRSTNSPENNGTEQLLGRRNEIDEDGTSYPVDLDVDREGYFDLDSRYLVWEPDDVRRIIHLLQGGDKDERDDRP